MKLVPINEEEVLTINGSPLTIFIYKEQFNNDFLEDMAKSIFEDVIICQSTAKRLLWALVKTYDLNTPDFEQWKYLVKIEGNDWQLPFIQELNAKFILRERPKYEEVEESNDKGNLERYDLSLLVNAINMGLPLELLNEMSIDTFIDYQEVYGGEGERKPREATQEDIDAFFS